MAMGQFLRVLSDGGGGRPGRVQKHLTRAPVSFSVILLNFATLAVVGCVGPGLEPPNNDSTGVSGGAGAMMPQAGTSGSGSGGAAGTSVPVAGTTGATGGMEVTSSGGTGGENSGMGGMMAMAGAGGAAGTAGSAVADAGVDPVASAPRQDCETGRDLVMIDAPDAGEAMPCVVTLPENARAHVPLDILVAITKIDSTTGSSATTSYRNAGGLQTCGWPGEQPFIFRPDASALATEIELCPEACNEAVVESAVIELLYGCELPPETP